jgi:hypothetical protein
MRFTSVATVITGALAVALTLGATSQPAEAGRVCSELDLSSPCISSSDLKARLNLFENDTNGRLRVRDADGEDAVQLDARFATVTNLFSNDENASNGLVKAWAQINLDGTVAACWRCNPAQTQNLDLGFYEVDFTPLDTDISGRPRSGTIDGEESVAGMIGLADRSGDESSVFVTTLDSTGAEADLAFVLIIY